MKEYKCPKCNSKNLFVKKVGNNTGLYCGDCGAWIKWVGKNKLRAFEYLTKQKHVDDANSKKDELFMKPKIFITFAPLKQSATPKCGKLTRFPVQ